MSVPHRWQGSEGSAVASQVIERLQRGKSLDGLGLGTRDHRVDLSGLPAAPSPAGPEKRAGGLVVQAVGGLVEINGRSLKGLDFSGARLSGWRLTKCELVDCRFNVAACAEWILRECVIRDCSFDQANLRDSMLGTSERPTTWERVTFVKADLRHAAALGAVFTGCDFSNARLENATFNQCKFVRSRFAGRVEEVLLDGRALPGRPPPAEMDDVDFSDAHLINVDFRGFSLKNVVLPRDGDVFLIRHFPCVGRKVIEALAGNQSKAAGGLRAVLENSLGGPQNPDSSWVFNRRDWKEWGGAELAALAESTMRKAEADCA